MSLLDKLLAKRGIEKIEELTPEEQSTYYQWKASLTGEAVTPEVLKQFCASQIAIIEEKADGVTPLTMLQQACLHVYRNIIKVIDAPEIEREAVERQLIQMINS